MTKVPTRLLTLYSAEIDTTGDTYTIKVPKREVEMGDVDPEATHQIGLFEKPTSGGDSSAERQPSKNGDANSNRNHIETDHGSRGYSDDGPPVEKGEQVKVEIESIGKKGDGIAKVDKGYVIIVPDTNVGEKITARITDTKENVGFGEVIERHQPPTV